MADTLYDYWRRFTRHHAYKLVLLLERLIRRSSLVGNPTFFDTDDFPWIRTLEADWKAIRGELDRILEHREALPNFQDISKDQRAITKDDRWKTFFLYGFGLRSEAACAWCPETTRVLEQIPGLVTAFFSILAPGKHIPEHRGVYNGVLRCHLGLKVPEPAEECRLRVADDVRHWREGRCLLFDDTYPHEVWNDTDGERVVLLLDVERPLSPFAAAVNRTVLRLVARTPYVQDARANQEHWEGRFREALREPDHQASAIQ